MADIAKASKFGNAGKNLLRFFRDVRNELKKVIWPNWEQLVNNTSTVLLACLVIGIIIWLFDFALVKLSEVIFIK